MPRGEPAIMVDPNDATRLVKPGADEVRTPRADIRKRGGNRIDSRNVY